MRDQTRSTLSSSDELCFYLVCLLTINPEYLLSLPVSPGEFSFRSTRTKMVATVGISGNE